MCCQKLNCDSEESFSEESSDDEELLRRRREREKKRRNLEVVGENEEELKAQLHGIKAKRDRRRLLVAESEEEEGEEEEVEGSMIGKPEEYSQDHEAEDIERHSEEEEENHSNDSDVSEKRESEDEEGEEEGEGEEKDGEDEDEEGDEEEEGEGEDGEKGRPWERHSDSSWSSARSPQGSITPFRGTKEKVRRRLGKNVFRFSRCKKAFTQKQMAELGVPLPEEHKVILEDGLHWGEIFWSPDGVTIKGKFYGLVRAHFLSDKVEDNEFMY